MLIAHCIRALIAVLGLAAVVIPVASCNKVYFNETDAFYDFFRHKRSPSWPYTDKYEGGTIANVVENQSVRVTKKLHQRHTKTHQQHVEASHQHLEGHHAAFNRTGECCPTVSEKIEPRGGSNQDGVYVDLYQDHNYKQRFFELSCAPEVLDKPCNFINRRKSKCVQKWSYTYALVKNTDFNRTKHFPMFPVHEHGGATYTLDYIRVRSGCSCEVTLTKRRKKKNTKGHNLDDT